MTVDIGAVVAGIGAARRALEQGNAVDLGGLDAAINQLCEEAKTLAPPDRFAAADQMARLGEALDSLATALRLQGEAAQRQRAASAYGGEDGA